MRLVRAQYAARCPTSSHPAPTGSTIPKRSGASLTSTRASWQSGLASTTWTASPAPLELRVSIDTLTNTGARRPRSASRGCTGRRTESAASFGRYGCGTFSKHVTGVGGPPLQQHHWLHTTARASRRQLRQRRQMMTAASISMNTNTDTRTNRGLRHTARPTGTRGAMHMPHTTSARMDTLPTATPVRSSPDRSCCTGSTVALRTTTMKCPPGTTRSSPRILRSTPLSVETKMGAGWQVCLMWASPVPARRHRGDRLGPPTLGVAAVLWVVRAVVTPILPDLPRSVCWAHSWDCGSKWFAFQCSLSVAFGSACFVL
eukprot:Opistho-2@79170